MDEQEKQIQFKVFITKEQYEKVRAYGRKHGILATTGRHTGKPHLSKVVQIAIDSLDIEAS